MSKASLRIGKIGVLVVASALILGLGPAAAHQQGPKLHLGDAPSDQRVDAITERKRGEQTRIESEQHLRGVMENAADGIITIDESGRIETVNPALERMFGYAPGQLYGQSASVLMTDSDSRQHDSYIESYLKTGKGKVIGVGSREVTGRRKDGSSFPFELAVGEMLLGERRVFVGSLRDITERKRAEEALRESEAKLNAFFENAPVCLATYDDQLRYTKVNGALARANGVPSKEHIGRTISDVVPALAPLLETAYREILETGKSQLNTEFTTKLPGMEGDERCWLSSRFPIPGKDGRRGGFGTILVEITDRKRAEILLRDAIENIADGFVLFDADDRVVMWNQQFAILYPELADMLPKRPTAEEMFRERYRSGAVGDFDVPVDEYVEWRMEMRQKQGGTPAIHRHRDGRWFRTTERPTTDGGIVAISTDITELKAREQELYQAQKMEAVGQLTGGVAHDFNNLLTVVLGNLEMLRDDTRENEKLKRFIESAIHATERGAMLTERLLAFSRKQTLHPKGLDLNELVADMSDMLQRTLGETIVIETKAADSLWPVFADPAQVESALLNLALNSRDAMPNGGNLTIEATNIKIDDDYVAAHADVDPGEYVLLSVSDTGIGMTQEAVQRAFEPFFTTKEVGGGSGLGLSMVYGFAKQSGGHVTIYSEEGHGTTVKLYLPRAEQIDLQAEPDLPSVEPRAREETILVVEDDPDVRTLVVALLSDLGYEVLEAGDGTSAIKALNRRSRIDLMFTDVILAGGMSGPELAEEAKSIQPAMRILFMSGYPSEAMIRRGELEQGADLLNKPFRKADLALKIRGSLCQAAPVAANSSA